MDNRIGLLKASKLKKFIDRISYKTNYDKKLNKFHEKYEKYIAMPNEEFIMRYTDIVSMYEHKKMMITVIFITLVLSIVMDIWKFIGDILIKVLIFANANDRDFVQLTKLLSCFIIVLTLIAAILLIFYLSKSLRMLSKEKIVMEELKLVRERQRLF